MRPGIFIVALIVCCLLLSACAETYASLWLWKYRRDGGYGNEYNGLPKE